MSVAGPQFSYPPMPLGRPSQIGEPTWELASLFPHQGDWTEHDYLWLDRNERWMYELVHGCLAVLPMPTVSHQEIALYIRDQLHPYVKIHQLGRVLIASCPVRLGKDHYREPDVFFVRPERVKSANGQPEGADLVVEVVSGGELDRERDLVKKRREYAEAGIPRILDRRSPGAADHSLGARRHFLSRRQGLQARRDGAIDLAGRLSS